MPISALAERTRKARGAMEAQGCRDPSRAARTPPDGPLALRSARSRAARAAGGEMQENRVNRVATGKWVAPRHDEASYSLRVNGPGCRPGCRARAEPGLVPASPSSFLAADRAARRFRSSVAVRSAPRLEPASGPPAWRTRPIPAGRLLDFGRDCFHGLWAPGGARGEEGPASPAHVTVRRAAVALSGCVDHREGRPCKHPFLRR
jgi:hypothetical protein